MADCSVCSKGGCCFDHCCNWDTCECKDCDECLPLEVRLRPMEPRDPAVCLKRWEPIGKDIKRTPDGVTYTSFHLIPDEEEQEPVVDTPRERRTRPIPGAEDRKLPEPKKLAAGSGVFGIRSLKAAHGSQEK